MGDWVDEGCLLEGSGRQLARRDLDKYLDSEGVQHKFVEDVHDVLSVLVIHARRVSIPVVYFIPPFGSKLSIFDPAIVDTRCHSKQSICPSVHSFACFWYMHGTPPSRHADEHRRKEDDEEHRCAEPRAA